MDVGFAEIYDLNIPRPKIGISANTVVTTVGSMPSSRDNTFKSQTISACTAQAVLKSMTFPILPPTTGIILPPEIRTYREHYERSERL